MTHETLEQRIKRACGGAAGDRLITLAHKGHGRLALARIDARGVLSVLIKPRKSDMYHNWWYIRGDAHNTRAGAVLVWPARDAYLMACFDGEPVATIQLSGEEVDEPATA